MKSKWTIAGGIVAIVLLALAVGFSQAQGPEPPGEGVEPQGEAGVQAVVDNVIPIQGRLTDASGNPLNGNYNITASIYNVPSGGTALCSDADTVTVNNGLFNMNVDYCTGSTVNGQQLYLGIQVGSDAEMTPRQAIYPVPYAWSLRPGAIISNTSSSGHGMEVWSAGGGGATGTALWVVNTNNDRGIALWARAQGTDATVIVSNNGTGPLFKGFGGDGGEEEFSVANDGTIKSEADTQIAVSPLKMVPRYDANVTLRPYYTGMMEVRPNITGTHYVIVPVDLPNVLFGTPLKLKSIRICSACDTSASYIDTLYVGWSTDSGYHDTISSDTDHGETTWTCYTVQASTPEIIAGPVYIDFLLNFAGVGGSHDIRIGKIILTLTEQ